MTSRFIGDREGDIYPGDKIKSIKHLTFSESSRDDHILDREILEFKKINNISKEPTFGEDLARMEALASARRIEARQAIIRAQREVREAAEQLPEGSGVVLIKEKDTDRYLEAPEVSLAWDLYAPIALEADPDGIIALGKALEARREASGEVQQLPPATHLGYSSSHPSMRLLI